VGQRRCANKLDPNYCVTDIIDGHERQSELGSISNKAWENGSTSTEANWHRLEDEAKLLKVGLWADEFQIPPWKWRSFDREMKQRAFDWVKTKTAEKKPREAE
jgi:hypothetical protein